MRALENFRDCGNRLRSATAVQITIPSTSKAPAMCGQIGISLWRKPAYDHLAAQNSLHGDPQYGNQPQPTQPRPFFLYPKQHGQRECKEPQTARDNAVRELK